MRRWTENTRLDLVIVATVWAAVRVFPLMRVSPLFEWEVWEGKKLLDYGFWARSGAILHNFFMSGRLAHPWQFNYTNHPYPILWLFTLLYSLFGPWAPVLLVLLASLGTSLLVFYLLKEDFGAQPALFATLLYVTAPEAVFFSISTSAVAFGAFFWPLGVFLIRRLKKTSMSTWAQPVSLGLMVLAAGQSTWFALTLVPAFLLLSAETNGPRSQFLQSNLRNKCWWGIFAGASLSVFLFAAQVAFYTPDFPELWKYAFGQAGLNTMEASRLRMLTGVALKGSVLVGPALVLGLLAGVAVWLRQRTCPLVVRASGLYLGLFALATMTLTRFAFRERSLYSYLVFPGTCLTAWALDQIRINLWRWSLLLTACVGVAYIQAKVAIPSVSRTSQALGRAIASYTQPEDLVLSNLHEMHSPFPQWDVGGGGAAKLTADRMFFLSITNQNAVADLLRRFHGDTPPVVFLRTAAEPIDSGLNEILATRGQLIARIEFQPLVEPETWAERLRFVYWKLQGKPYIRQTSSAAAQVQPVPLEFIRVTM
jgi:hypothetical protein